MTHSIRSIADIIPKQKFHVVFEFQPRVWENDRETFEKIMDQEIAFGTTDLKTYMMEQFDLFKKAGIKHG